MRRPLIAGNWKMYKTISEALEFVQALKPLVVASTHCQIVVAPVFTAIKPVADRLEGSNIEVAAQDVAAESGPGAFTGEVSAKMIFDAGARLSIIGHSERRQYYCETDETVNKKIRAAFSAGLGVDILRRRAIGRARRRARRSSRSRADRRRIAQLDSARSVSYHHRLRACMGNRHRANSNARNGPANARLYPIPRPRDVW